MYVDDLKQKNYYNATTRWRENPRLCLCLLEMLECTPSDKGSHPGWKTPCFVSAGGLLYLSKKAHHTNHYSKRTTNDLAA